MIDITPRKQLGLIDYSNVPADYIYIGRLPSPFSDLANGCEMIVDFFVAKGLVVNRRERRINGLVDSAINQFEIPLTGIKWMIEAIEQGFERPPSAGGIAKTTRHTDTRINDERLRLMYGVSVGGEGVGGYAVVNSSRSSYILPEASQEFSMTIDIWREFGRAFFNALQKRIEAGEFN